MLESELVDFFIEIDELKYSLRFSTLPLSFRDNSADHSWKVAFMVLEFAERWGLGVDVNRSVRMALVHDVCEYIHGDIDSFLVRQGKVTKEEKKKIEREAMLGLKDRYSFGQGVYDLWEEFEEKKTREAKFVNAFDKLETLTHMVSRNYWEVADGEGELGLLHTATYADKACGVFPELMPVLRDIKLRLKKGYEEKGFEWKKEYNFGLE